MLLVAGIVVAAALAAGAAWFAGWLVVDRGRLLRRLDTLSRRLEEASTIPSYEQLMEEGLPVGSPAADFALRDMAGNERELGSWRGKPMLLLFLAPDCEHSARVLSALASEARGPALVVVPCGDAEELDRVARRHGLDCVVLRQDHEQLASQFFVPATPAAYLLDAEGRVAAPRALGCDAILACSRAGDAGSPRMPADVTPLVPDETAIIGEGLRQGERAPAISLPTLDGGRFSLDDLRGRRVLLIFADPACRPCRLLAPKLGHLQRDSPDRSVVMISRGDPEASREMAVENSFDFPVALQRHWETSRAFRMLATPVAYAVDESGVVASSAAVGETAVLALARDRG